MFERNKAFWALFSALTLLVLTCMYVLDNLEQEHLEHEYETTVLTITPDGKLYFGRQPITRYDLGRKISQLNEETGLNHVLHVRVDCDVPFGTVEVVIASIQQAGYNKIAVGVIDVHTVGFDSFESEIPITPIECFAARRELHNSDPTSEVGRVAATIPIVEAKDPLTSGTVVTLNLQPMSLKQLSVELKRLLAQREASLVHVKAPGDMEFSRVMEILTAVKQSGVRTIGLQIGCPESAVRRGR